MDKMTIRILSKVGLLLVIFGFFMPITLKFRRYGYRSNIILYLRQSANVKIINH